MEDVLKSQFSRTWPYIISAVTFVTAIATITSLKGEMLVVVSTLCGVIIAASLGFSYGRGIRNKRQKALDELGVVRVYTTATEDDVYLSEKIVAAKNIRILAVNAEMLLKNLPTPFKGALKSGANIKVLIADPDSVLVKEMEQMEIDDGRDSGSRTIKECILQTEPEFLNLINEVRAELPTRDHGVGNVPPTVEIRSAGIAG